MVDRFEGKRLNSPNDVVFKSNGDMYFTDPPYGLPKQDDDPAKELKFNGVYRLTAAGKLEALAREMTRPNGLAFSPDERRLYVANSDPASEYQETVNKAQALVDALALAAGEFSGSREGESV